MTKLRPIRFADYEVKGLDTLRYYLKICLVVIDYLSLYFLFYFGSMLILAVILRSLLPLLLAGLILFVFHWIWSSKHPGWDTMVKHLFKQPTSWKVRLVGLSYSVQVVYFTVVLIPQISHLVDLSIINDYQSFMAKSVMLFFLMVFVPMVCVVVVLTIVMRLLKGYRKRRWYNGLLTACFFASSFVGIALLSLQFENFTGRFEEELVVVGKVLIGLLPLIFLRALFKGEKAHDLTTFGESN